MTWRFMHWHLLLPLVKHEVSAALDVAHGFEVICKELHACGKDISDHLAAMLTRFR